MNNEVKKNIAKQLSWKNMAIYPITIPTAPYR